MLIEPLTFHAHCIEKHILEKTNEDICSRLFASLNLTTLNVIKWKKKAPTEL